MVLGVGLDVVDIKRFAQKIEKSPTLVSRLFVPQERNLGVASLAARFAAKEAFAKALGAPAGLSWQHAWVEKNSNGAPYFCYTGSVEQLLVSLQIREIKLSLSHDAGIASAIVIATG